VSLTACGAILDIPDDPQLAGAASWSCLASGLSTSPPQVDRVSVQVRACNFVSTNCSSAVTGLTAKLCDKRDVDCSTPLRSNINDENGAFDFEVETGGRSGTGFDGYLSVTAPAEMCNDSAVFGAAAPAVCALAPSCNPDLPDQKCRTPTFAPARLFFNPAIRESGGGPIVLPLLPTSSVLSIVLAAGSTRPDPSYGFVFVTALSCEGKPAPHVAVSVDRPGSEVSYLYLDHGVVSAAARETDVSGLAVISNVAPGTLKVSAHTAGELPMRVDEVSVQISPFVVTYVSLRPSPNAS